MLAKPEIIQHAKELIAEKKARARRAAVTGHGGASAGARRTLLKV
jgi:hypothetical protein